MLYSIFFKKWRNKQVHSQLNLLFNLIQKYVLNRYYQLIICIKNISLLSLYSLECFYQTTSEILIFIYKGPWFLLIKEIFSIISYTLKKKITWWLIGTDIKIPILAPFSNRGVIFSDIVKLFLIATCVKQTVSTHHEKVFKQKIS